MSHEPYHFKKKTKKTKKKLKNILKIYNALGIYIYRNIET